MLRVRSLVLPALLALPAVSACTAQADGQYQGQALATLSGTLDSQRSTPIQDPEVSLVWSHYGEMYDLIGAEKVDAKGLLPQFSLSIYDPPPAEFTDVIDGESYTVGLVAVGSTTTDFTQADQWYGTDFDRVVVYLPDGTKPGGTLEAFLHGAQTPGFHVYSVKRLTEAERQARLDCVNALPDCCSGPSLPLREAYATCGGLGNDELYPVDTDLDTQFDVTIVAEQDILTIVNKLPHW
jgi:hypothetical protein